MRIVLIGQEAFGKQSLGALLDQGEEVVGVITAPDVKDGNPNPVRILAEERSLPCLETRSLKGEQVYEWVRQRRPDLLVLAYVTQYIPKPVLELGAYGGINYHPSLLPKYRGGTAINWAIVCGERETGVTIHYIDEGVDTGDIILQRRVQIGPDDTAASLYYQKLFPLGVEMIAEAVRLIREGRAPRYKQDMNLASFQPVMQVAHTEIDWRRPALRIHDLVRGAAPRPGAWTRWQGERLMVWESARLGQGPTRQVPVAGAGQAVPRWAPGQVLAVESEGLLVATGEGVIRLRRLGAYGGPKMKAAEYADLVGLKPGAILGGSSS